MSIVCWRDGVLAADRLAVDPWDHRVGEVPKIFRTKSALYGSIGLVSELGKLYEWVRDGEQPDKRPSMEGGFEALKIDPTGVLLSGKAVVFIKIDAPYIAIGSGCHVALGAMAMGATAEEAVQCAIDRVTSCGGGIDVIRWAEQANQYRPEPTIVAPADRISDIHFGGPR